MGGAGFRGLVRAIHIDIYPFVEITNQLMSMCMLYIYIYITIYGHALRGPPLPPPSMVYGPGWPPPPPCGMECGFPLPPVGWLWGFWGFGSSLSF